MTDKKTQPEALRLADELDAEFPHYSPVTEAAAELRRLHEANQELLNALSWIRKFIHKHPENKGEVVIRDANGNEWWFWIDQCDAAITKATGGQA